MASFPRAGFGSFQRDVLCKIHFANEFSQRVTQSLSMEQERSVTFFFIKFALNHSHWCHTDSQVSDSSPSQVFIQLLETVLLPPCFSSFPNMCKVQQSLSFSRKLKPSVAGSGCKCRVEACSFLESQRVFGDIHFVKLLHLSRILKKITIWNLLYYGFTSSLLFFLF